MNRSATGARDLNMSLQAALNPDGPGVEKFGWRYSVGDKVIQTENDYDKEVFNGDIGLIQSIDAENQELVVDFDGRAVHTTSATWTSSRSPTPSRSTSPRAASTRRWSSRSPRSTT